MREGSGSRTSRRVVAVLLGGAVAVLLASCDASRIYSYRIATRGPVVANVDEFAAQVDETLNDPRGWSLGGAIGYVRTGGPSDFTVWLSTAGNVPSFSGACSSMWSCRVGPNVVINQDRWLGATATWPFGLREYRHYVVNHETGHWLGLGHTSCAGTGPSPVMVQQSKGGSALGACAFNTWPLEGERQAVGRIRGVAPRPVQPPHPPFGNLDQVAVTRDEQGRPTQVQAIGWAVDLDTTDPLPVVLMADGKLVGQGTAGASRPDVAAAVPGYGENHGFDLTAAVDPSSEVVCAVAFGPGSGQPMTQLGCDVVK